MTNNIEIGSEFEMPDEGVISACTEFSEYELTLSGRTAIHLAIQDLLSQREVQKAWLPSYCCASMIQPFQDSGIPVCFYSVNRDRASGISRERFVPKYNDVVVSMDFFGFSDYENQALIESCLSNGVLVIEDTTHSFLSSNSDYNADYCIASIRKWFPLAFGGVVKKRDNSIKGKLHQPNEQIVKQKRRAMQEKTDYLNSSERDPDAKAQFLDKFRICNQSLLQEYKNFGIDAWSKSVLMKQDIDEIRQCRRENAKMLLNGLKHIRNINPLFPSIREEDCPLFVPIVLEKRDQLQKRLADQKIYCPVHWPKPRPEAKSDLYESEISLICDQRYGKKDMERILDVLTKFSKDN